MKIINTESLKFCNEPVVNNFFFFFLRGGYRLLTFVTQNAKVFFFFFLNLFTCSSGIFHNSYANIGHTIVFLIV